ncbi:uncharacterized protein LOC129600296 isoform X1 [Paramacrobiotus metropolitanus]|uniref:uncharacterized protein LOC129600296 isoform X1 n=1 Tax=Paramacrobiotus metropolitanus TaxID=2943436 RepID=UPI002445F65F|nr:uncharacterized protein LOC129600296 isoform X1 [Paramacrobiotus metropolitanus]
MRSISRRDASNTQEMPITELPHPIMASILLTLDVTSQFRMSRVCALWRLIYHQYVNHQYVLFDLGTTGDNKIPPVLSEHSGKFGDLGEDCILHAYAEFVAYKLVAMLDSICVLRTQTLALMQSKKHVFGDQFDLFTVVTTTETVLASKSIRMPMLIVKNDSDTVFKPSFLDIKRNHRSGIWECSTGLSKIMAVCDEFVLINVTAEHLITQAAMRMLQRDGASVSCVRERADTQRFEGHCAMPRKHSVSSLPLC